MHTVLRDLSGGLSQIWKIEWPESETETRYALFCKMAAT